MAKNYDTNGYVYTNAHGTTPTMKTMKCTVKHKGVMCDYTLEYLSHTSRDEGTHGTVLEQMVAHLFAAHKVDACQYCNMLLKRSSMSKHQGTDECQCAARRKHLRDEGYCPMYGHERMFVDYFDQKLRELVANLPIINTYGKYVGSHTYLTNAKTLEECRGQIGRYSGNFTPANAALVVQIEEEACKAFLRIKAFLGLRFERTEFHRGGWGRGNRIRHVSWVRKDVLDLMRNYAIAHGVSKQDAMSDHRINLWGDESISMLSDYIDASTEQRDAIRGTLELASEGWS